MWALSPPGGATGSSPRTAPSTSALTRASALPDGRESAPRLMIETGGWDASRRPVGHGRRRPCWGRASGFRPARAGPAGSGAPPGVPGRSGTRATLTRGVGAPAALWSRLGRGCTWVRGGASATPPAPDPHRPPPARGRPRSCGTRLTRRGSNLAESGFVYLVTAGRVALAAPRARRRRAVSAYAARFAAHPRVRASGTPRPQDRAAVSGPGAWTAAPVLGCRSRGIGPLRIMDLCPQNVAGPESAWGSK
jgi:hypothetical protein